jgi:hypothetical protein
MFDPSWFLILKVSNSIIDQEIGRDGSAVSSFPGGREFRDAAREQPVQKKSIFLLADRLIFSTTREISFASTKCIQRSDSDKS